MKITRQSPRETFSPLSPGSTSVQHNTSHSVPLVRQRVVQEVGVMVSFSSSLLLSLFLQFSLLLTCFLYSSVGSYRACNPLGVSPLWCELPTAAVSQGSPCLGIGHLWLKSLRRVLTPAWVTHNCSPSEPYLLQHRTSPPKSASPVVSPTMLPTPNVYHLFLCAFEQRHHVLL